MPRRFSPLISFALWTLQAVLVDAAYYHSSNDNEADLPGHSDLYRVTGSSGFGCQVADNELIPYRTPDRSGEDDGSLWTGETVVHISRHSAEEGESPKTVCNGTFYLPTVFWIGPYLQGEDGAGGNFAIGMLAFETNSTDKSDAWHVYRPCLAKSDEAKPPPDVWNPSTSAFKMKAGVHYADSTHPPDNTTVGLSLVARPPGADAPKASPSQIYFNGTLNDVKESKEYFGEGESGIHFFSFFSKTDLNCTRVSEGKDNWEPPSGASASLVPGSRVNGTLSNDTIVLRMTSTDTHKIMQGVEEPKPRVTNVGVGRTDMEITFNGRFDSRNSSQGININTTSDTVVKFISAGAICLPSISLFCGVSGFISLCIFL